MKNQVQLITYVDRLSGGGIRDLQTLLEVPLSGIFGGAHLLPLFYQYDGSDSGFDPIDHTMVIVQPNPHPPISLLLAAASISTGLCCR
jgi:sucrose phosphorylase